MKKLLAFLNTPARLVIAVVMFILLGEFLIMVLIENVYNALPKDAFLKGISFEFLDPILLVFLVAPVLFLLIFKPMRGQQDRNEQQLAELQRFQKELEVAAKKTEQAYQEWTAALDVVADPIFLHDPQFRILRCNRAYQQRAGLPFAQIIGQPYYEIFPKTGAPFAACLRAMKGKEEEEEEVRTGGQIYRVRAFSVADAQGTFLYAVHLLENISEKRQAEVQLRLFRDSLDQSSDGIAIVDPATSRFLDVNETICRDLRYTRDDLLQRGVIDIQTNIRDVAAWQAHVQALIPQGQILLEFEALCKDGSRFPAEVSIRHFTARDQAHIIAVVRNITARKQTEETLRKSNERFDLAVKGTNDGIWDWDIKTNTNYFSPRFLELLGYGPDEVDHALVTFESFLHPEDRTWVFDRIRQHLEDEAPYNVEYRMRMKNGEYRWFQARGEALRDPSGKPVRMAGSITDISARKQAEAKLAERLEELRRWQDATSGREMRVLDLKREVNQLLAKAGQPPRYPSAENDPQGA